ncbi:CehA/McbA family metallohydrolase [Paenibacillus chungangensis]|uniref:CehA/McbA family metallohydrolase n=1 Tax=Paenibacillus chungangensis TaxID=696535 RepID=A0ABW3HQ94_9BACL
MQYDEYRGKKWGVVILLSVAVALLMAVMLATAAAATTGAEAGVTSEDPGFTYGPAARDWVEATDYYYLENEHVKMTVGTVRLSTFDETDYGPDASGNDRWGSLTKGSLMDAAPKPGMRDNLDYTEFVLRSEPARTWWYPAEKLEHDAIGIAGDTIAASGDWDANPDIKSSIIYSLVEGTPLIKMQLTLTNEGGAPFQGHLGYIIDSDEQLEQQSYVPGWGWRGGQVSQYITSGWNRNYLFNGSQDKYTGHTAHAIIWPEYQQPSALIPEGYITGAWFEVSLAANGSQELIIYHLPHRPSSAYEPYVTAQFWADAVRDGTSADNIGEVSGMVADASGEPSPHVELDLYTMGGELMGSATTDEEGAYHIFALKGQEYLIRADNETEQEERTLTALIAGDAAIADFTMAARNMEVLSGVTKGDPGFTYAGTSRDWWPNNEYYYLESPEVKLTIGTVRTAGMDPVDWSNNASGNNKWGSLTPGHMMDAVPKLTGAENLDFTEFVLSSDLGVTPEDEADGKHMEWSWFHPLDKLELPTISRSRDAITAQGDWDRDAGMKSSVRYSIVEGTPLIKMEITLDNETGADFEGHFGYIIDPDQPGEQHSYLPGVNWVYNQEKQAIRDGWTDNYLFSGIHNAFSGNTAHAIIWPVEQQPDIVMHEGIFNGVWFNARVADGERQEYVVYHLPHVPGPAEKPYNVAEFWSSFIREHGIPESVANVTGEVADTEGNPVSGVRITAVDDSGTAVMEAMTNDKGKYQLFLREGLYTLSAQHEAYGGDSLSIDLTEVRRGQADFVMDQYADVAIVVPDHVAAGELFNIDIVISNLTNQPLTNVLLDLQSPYFVYLLDDDSVELPVLAAGGQVSIQVEALALEGGRGLVQATSYSDSFAMKGKASLDVVGEGYFGGDTHSHTEHSDGVHSVAENASGMYDRRQLSWIWNTDHNTDSQRQDALDATGSYGGRFLSLSGTEITTDEGHALALGYSGVPRADVGDPASGYSWQDSMDDVTGEGALFYMAHPFEQTFAFTEPYSWSGFTGVEVWNGTWHALDGGVNEQAFRYWDELNIHGDGKYYGISGSDGHTKSKVGDPYSKGRLAELAEEDVLNMLRTGGYFGSNGPEIRFEADGIDMGGTLRLEEAGIASFRIQAYDPNSDLTHIRIVKHNVTGNISDYDGGEVVFEENLTGMGRNTFVETVRLPVANDAFYRLEVRSEKAQPNSSGIGPLTGTGFAYSNPIWTEIIGSVAASNAKGIESIVYKNKNKYLIEERFGIFSLFVKDKAFDPKKLKVSVSEGASVQSVVYTELKGGESPLGMAEITVMADDGSSNVYRCLIQLMGGGA